VTGARSLDRALSLAYCLSLLTQKLARSAQSCGFIFLVFYCSACPESESSEPRGFETKWCFT
jgi:hypothetical protein